MVEDSNPSTAYEIVYDDKQLSIISFIPINPKTLSRGIDSESGKGVWIQFADDPVYKRILWDSQIINPFYYHLNEYDAEEDKKL